MGSELVLTTLAYRQGTPLDWAAGHAAVDALGMSEALEVADALNLDGTEVGHDERGYFTVASAEDAEDAVAAGKARRELHEALEYLSGSPRDVVELLVPESSTTLLVAGGMSWGDVPSDAFAYMQTLSWVPSVLAAVGFLGD